MTPRPSTVDHIDLTASLPHLRSSLTPQASEFSGIVSDFHRRQYESDRKDAEEFSLASVGLMLGWVAGFVLMLSVAVMLWGPQLNFIPR